MIGLEKSGQEQRFVNFIGKYIWYQMIKWWICLFLSLRVPADAVCQVSDGEIMLLQKLDSLQKSGSIARHFAGLYFNTTGGAIDFFLNAGQGEKEFIQRLEKRFAALFFAAADSFAAGKQIPAVWHTYFADTSLSALQYRLLGINAHINGDIWQALTAEFSPEELQKGSAAYFTFHKGLRQQYREFYRAALQSNNKLKLLHSVTGGMDKLYGELMLKRWRKRQMKLALLYGGDKEKFSRQLDKLHQKMKHINQLILTNL